MTRTEARLADALNALTETVRDDQVRPLRDPGRSRGRLPVPLVVLGAAASVLAIIGGLLLASRSTGDLPRPPAKPFADTGTATQPPPYYVTASRTEALVVRSTATGLVRDTTRPLAGGLWTIAASANGRFFVAVSAPNQTAGDNIMAYRFSLTPAGKIAGLTAVSAVYFKPNPCMNLAYNALPARSRCLPQLPWLSSVSAAISDNGLQIAIAGLRNSAPEITFTDLPYLLLVEDVATHHVRSWQFPAGRADSQWIGSVSWTADGRSVQFLADTCVPGRTVLGSCLGRGSQIESVRSAEWNLAVPRSGLLGPAVPLLTLPHGTLQTVSGPGGVTALSLQHGVAVTRLAAARSGHEHVLYEAPLSAWVHGRAYGVPSMSVDASGRYVLISWNEADWLADGRLHVLSGFSLPSVQSVPDW
jgi:hypothetical protein